MSRGLKPSHAPYLKYVFFIDEVALIEKSILKAVIEGNSGPIFKISEP